MYKNDINIFAVELLLPRIQVCSIFETGSKWFWNAVNNCNYIYLWCQSTGMCNLFLGNLMIFTPLWVFDCIDIYLAKYDLKLDCWVWYRVDLKLPEVNTSLIEQVNLFCTKYQLFLYNTFDIVIIPSNWFLNLCIPFFSLLNSFFFKIR